VAFIFRDAFARVELHREQVSGSAKGCWFCGMLNRFKKLFVYRVESDGGRVSPIRGEFCCKGCMEAYHG
jgi:hypothetical protein